MSGSPGLTHDTLGDGGPLAARICLFLFAALISVSVGVEETPELIVWNVGQGQWATIRDQEGCWHFDMGGEFAPWKKIMALCRARPNRVSLSHWDMDHIVFVAKARSRLPNMCLINAPLGRSSPHKESWLKDIPSCPSASPFDQWANPKGKTANDKSWVVQWRGVLAPGDSPRAQEKTWVHALKHLAQVHYLILGHHGSRTSTSLELINSLPHLRLAISSARQRRYGHPHAEVVRELHEAKVPLLRTEEWGNVHIPL